MRTLDLDETIMYSIYSAFGFQGQSGSALSRLILLEEKLRSRDGTLEFRNSQSARRNPEQPGIMVGRSSMNLRTGDSGIHRDR